MNKKFKIGQKVVCTWGLNKGRVFVIELLMKNGDYSCSLAENKDGKYYQYDDNKLELFQ